MNFRRVISVLILVLFLGFSESTFGQENTWVLSPEFSYDLDEEKNMSSVYTFTFKDSIDFTGTSAFESLEVSEGYFEYRYAKEGNWSEWKSFRAKFENKKKDRRTFEGLPVLGSFDKIQFSSLYENAKPTFRLFFAFAVELDLSPAKMAMKSDCACELPAYCGRSCWCPSGNCNPIQEPDLTEPSHVIVHHSGGFIESENFPAVVAYYYDLHVNTNGWDDIGYNWLIDPNGVIYEGRGSLAQGAHFSCMNEYTTGICMIGNYNEVEPTEASMTALKDLTSWEVCDKEIDPSESIEHVDSEIILPTICGHRDGNDSVLSCTATICPGDMLYNALEATRAEIIENECLDFVLEVAEESLTSNFHLSPNPFWNYVTVSAGDNWSKDTLEYSVYNVYGSKVIEGSEDDLFENSAILDLSTLTSGVYFLEITDGEFLEKHQLVRK